jgi:hypothetical protein
VSRAVVLLLAVIAGGCQSEPGTARRSAADEGYLLGAADTVKQLYWAKQALEAPSERRPAGKIKYYTWQESGVTADGRKLAPETVAVPVFIPAPVPASEHSP